MKNTLLAALVIFILGNFSHAGLPWWCLAPIAAIVGWFIPRGGWGAFFGGFLGGFLLWLFAAWISDNSNGGMLSTKVGQVFTLQGWQLLLVTGLLGALVGAFSALTGRLARGMLTTPSRKRNYLQEKRR